MAEEGTSYNTYIYNTPTRAARVCQPARAARAHAPRRVRRYTHTRARACVCAYAHRALRGTRRGSVRRSARVCALWRTHKHIYVFACVGPAHFPTPACRWAPTLMVSC